jgi:uncharacterized protein (TIGR02145 family)
MKKITLLSLITFLCINNLVTQTPVLKNTGIDISNPPIDIDKLPAFICGVSEVSDINSNVYNTVQIGKQCWMQSNLKVSKYQNGAAIPTGLIAGAWANTTSGAYAIIDNVNANDAIYGKLYNWYAVEDGRGICPTGWHVPSDAEWTTLTTYLGGERVAGRRMKSIGTTYWNCRNTGTINNNDSGFSALPGGSRASLGSFIDDVTKEAFFWSATEKGDGPFAFIDAWYRLLYCDIHNVSRNNASKSMGASVRCLRD